MSENTVSLPTNRAFVVQLRGNSVASRSAHRGRVEHVASGRATHFPNEDEFWAFVDTVLSSECSEESDPERLAGD